MILKYEGYYDEMLARGGTFDISGVTPVIDKQFWGFKASDGAKLTAIKGVAIKPTAEASTLAEIRAAEVDISGVLITDIALGLDGGSIYRADGYIITSITLADATSLLHCYKTINQISE
jgi:hypothetical protein